MDVAILYSGGKDSNYAVQKAQENDWNIKYLLSVKPTRTDCYLFHYATVENTEKQAEILGLDHHMLECDVADPEKEAELVKEFVEEHPVDAVVLGGTGLQETQLRSVQRALRPLNIETFAAHAGYEHDVLIEEMIEEGYEFMITQIASEGLDEDWLGTVLNEDNFKELKKRAVNYGFHIGGEGGYFDTFVLDSPLFDHEIRVNDLSKNMESENAGHIVFDDVEVVEKEEEIKY